MSASLVAVLIAAAMMMGVTGLIALNARKKKNDAEDR